MPITTGGLPALANFTLDGRDALTVKTFVTAQMLERGYLAGPNLYASLAHTPQILDTYFTSLEPVFQQLSTMNDSELLNVLPHGTAQSGFRRLT
jgi:glutamate-1-semialdehyde 2,1-aminomutase